jgi:Cu+-exporting ATPase
MDTEGRKSFLSTLFGGGHAPRSPEAGAGAKDPVCGMTVDPQKAAASSVHAGKTYYFCCAPCRDKFSQEPQKYLGSS